MAVKVECNSMDTKLRTALLERLEDEYAKCVAHMKDPTVAEGKSSTINIKVVVTPDQRRMQFDWDLQVGSSMAPHYSTKGTLYAVPKPSEKGGGFELVEHDPNALPF